MRTITAVLWPHYMCPSSHPVGHRILKQEWVGSTAYDVDGVQVIAWTHRFLKFEGIIDNHGNAREILNTLNSGSDQKC